MGDLLSAVFSLKGFQVIYHKLCWGGMFCLLLSSLYFAWNKSVFIKLQRGIILYSCSRLKSNFSLFSGRKHSYSELLLNKGENGSVFQTKFELLPHTCPQHLPCTLLSRVSILTPVGLWIQALLCCCCWVWAWQDKKFNQILASGQLWWDLGQPDFKCLQ